MALNDILRQINPSGFDFLTTDVQQRGLSNMYSTPVGDPFDIFGEGRSNYKDVGNDGSDGNSQQNKTIVTEADEAYISYSIGLKRTSDFPPGRLYKHLLGFILKESNNTDSGTYVVTNIYELNHKLRIDFFNAKTKLVAFIKREIVPILEENESLFPTLALISPYNNNKNNNNGDNGGDRFFDDDDDSEETEIDRLQYINTAVDLAIRLLGELMPNDLQLYQDKNKLTGWSMLPEFVDVSLGEGRKRRTSINDAATKILKRNVDSNHISTGVVNNALLTEINSTAANLYATRGYGDGADLDSIMDGDEEDVDDDIGATSDSPFSKSMIRLRRIGQVNEQIRAKYRTFFTKAMLLARSSHINGNQNTIPYLMLGGYVDNWYMMGAIDTFFEGRDVHKFGVSMANSEIAKFITDRRGVIYNIWGPLLKRGTVLYLKVMRNPSNPDIDSRRALQNLGRHGLDGYGSYIIEPCSTYVTSPLEESEDLLYYDIFGKQQRAFVINVGIVLYETDEIKYSMIERNKAIGLPNSRTGLYPTLAESKVAMIRLPKVEVLLKRAGY